MSGKGRFSKVLLTCLLWVALVCPAGALGACFQGLGDLPGGAFESKAFGISSGGSIVVGVGDPLELTRAEAFRWTRAGGMQALGTLPPPEGYSGGSQAHAVSADGSVVVGYADTPFYEAFRWTETDGMIGLGYLPGGSERSYAADVSADGSVVVGYSDSLPPGASEAFRWTPEGGMVGLGFLPGAGESPDSYGRGVSADGSVVVGGSDSTPGHQAFRWSETSGMVGLGDLSGGSFDSHAMGVSSDGSVVVGTSRSDFGYEAFGWTETGGMIGLGDLPGGEFESWATDVSADGSVVIGWGHTASGKEAFIWVEHTGIRSLKEVLTDDFGLDLTGWTLSEAWGISDSGLVIVGFGTNPDGDTEVWIADLRPGCGKAMPWLMLLLDGEE